MTFLVWVIAMVVAMVFVVVKNWPVWTVIPATVGAAVVVYVVWWAIKTAVSIAVVVGVICALCYGAWWVVIGPSPAKK